MLRQHFGGKEWNNLIVATFPVLAQIFVIFNHQHCYFHHHGLINTTTCPLRMVSSGSPMPLNGQQLMMQLDGITSAMTGMSVQEVVTRRWWWWSSWSCSNQRMKLSMKNSTRRRWTRPHQRRRTPPSAKLPAGGTLSTSPAWPRTLYLPHRFSC